MTLAACLIALAPAWGSAQTYVPMAVAGATWTVVEYGYGTIPPELGVTHYGLNGDTLIGATLYHKVYANPGALGASNPEPEFNPATAVYHGAFREDTDRKVWFVAAFTANEVLLYDFGIGVGQSFCFDIAPCGVECHEVQLVDSIEVNGQMRTRIHFGYNGQQQIWTEGIGAMHDPWSSLWCYVGNVEWTLNCYSEMGTQLYGDCNYPTGTQQQQAEAMGLIPFPLPATDHLHIPHAEAGCSWELTDLQGASMTRSKATGTVAHMDLSALAPGIYVLRRTDLGPTPTGTLVVKN